MASKNIYIYIKIISVIYFFAWGFFSFLKKMNWIIKEEGMEFFL